MDEVLVVPPGMKVSVSRGEAREKQPPPNNYAFVMNVSRLVGAASFTLATEHELRRANTDEIVVIKQTLQPYLTIGFTPSENKVVDGGPFEQLPQTARWRKLEKARCGTWVRR